MSFCAYIFSNRTPVYASPVGRTTHPEGPPTPLEPRGEVGRTMAAPTVSNGSKPYAAIVPKSGNRPYSGGDSVS